MGLRHWRHCLLILLNLNLWSCLPWGRWRRKYSLRPTRPLVHWLICLTSIIWTDSTPSNSSTILVLVVADAVNVLDLMHWLHPVRLHLLNHVDYQF